MIGQRIKQIREMRGMSQDELAKKIGYKGRDSICRIESEHTRLITSRLEQIARALDVSVQYLAGEIDDPIPYGVYHSDTLDLIAPLDGQMTIMTDDDDVIEIANLAMQLTPEKRKIAIQTMRAML